MLFKENLQCLIDNLDEIQKLIGEYQLDEFALAKPLKEDGQTLCFIISRKINQLDPIEGREIDTQLCELLRLEYLSGDVEVRIKESLTKGELDKIYGEIFSINEDFSCEKLRSFIEEKWGFSCTLKAKPHVVRKLDFSAEENPPPKKQVVYQRLPSHFSQSPFSLTFHATQSATVQDTKSSVDSRPCTFNLTPLQQESIKNLLSAFPGEQELNKAVKAAIDTKDSNKTDEQRSRAVMGPN